LVRDGFPAELNENITSPSKPASDYTEVSGSGIILKAKQGAD